MINEDVGLYLGEGKVWFLLHIVCSMVRDCILTSPYYKLKPIYILYCTELGMMAIHNIGICPFSNSVTTKWEKKKNNKATISYLLDVRKPNISLMKPCKPATASYQKLASICYEQYVI